MIPSSLRLQSEAMTSCFTERVMCMHIDASKIHTIPYLLTTQCQYCMCTDRRRLFPRLDADLSECCTLHQCEPLVTIGDHQPPRRCIDMPTALQRTLSTGTVSSPIVNKNGQRSLQANGYQGRDLRLWAIFRLSMEAGYERSMGWRLQGVVHTF